MRIVAALFLSLPVLAQAISAGLRVGVPVTSVFITDQPRHDAADRWLVGPAIEWHWLHGLTFGAEFLVRRSGLDADSVAARQAGVWTWELPGTLKYSSEHGQSPLCVRASLSTVCSILKVQKSAGAGPPANNSIAWTASRSRNFVTVVRSGSSRAEVFVSGSNGSGSSRSYA